MNGLKSLHPQYNIYNRFATCKSNTSLGFVADAHGHSYGARFSTEIDEGLGGEIPEESV